MPLTHHTVEGLTRTASTSSFGRVSRSSYATVRTFVRVDVAPDAGSVSRRSSVLLSTGRTPPPGVRSRERGRARDGARRSALAIGWFDRGRRPYCRARSGAVTEATPRAVPERVWKPGDRRLEPLAGTLVPALGTRRWNLRHRLDSRRLLLGRAGSYATHALGRGRRYGWGAGAHRPRTGVSVARDRAARPGAPAGRPTLSGPDGERMGVHWVLSHQRREIGTASQLTTERHACQLPVYQAGWSSPATAAAARITLLLATGKVLLSDGRRER